MKKRMILSLAASVIVTAGSLSAQLEYRLIVNQGQGWQWNTVGQNTGWHTAGGQQLQEMDPDGIYRTAGFGIRTPESAGSRVFQGGTLIVESGSTMSLKGAGIDKLDYVGNMVLSDSIISASDNGSLYFSAGNFEVVGTGTFFSNTANRSFIFSADNLFGDGNLVFSAVSAENNRLVLGINNGMSYTGDLSVQTGKLAFSDDFSIGGSLTLSDTSQVDLTHGVTVSAFTIAGTQMGVGTYTYDFLHANYGSIFTSGSSELGFVTVIPEPSTYAFVFGALAFALAYMRKRRAAIAVS